jgi:hypothetical protein
LVYQGIEIEKGFRMTQEDTAAPEFDYGLFTYDSKEQMLEKSKEFWNPGKTSN